MVHPDTHSLIEIFSQLSPADEDVMVSLPYRIGLYVSHADVTGGWDAQDSEIQSLTGILRDYSNDFCKTELSQKVLMDCLASRAKWPSWSQDVDQVPAQIGQIITTLESMLSEKELSGFCDVLTDIGIAVAMAFREGGEEAGERPLVREILARLGTVLSEKDPLDHINISESERSALKKITRAMRYSKRKDNPCRP
jgi:hypothetical protein